MERKFDGVFLHFGSDKTGSTAIQMALNLTRQQLLESGVIAYPPGGWHPQLGSYFCDAPEEFIYNRLTGAVDREAVRLSDEAWFADLNRWLEVAPPARALVFSYEGFMSLPAEALARMHKFCAKLARHVRVVLYVRPPLSYAVSALGQRAQMGVRVWASDDIPSVPYKTYLEAIKAIFGKDSLIIRPFTPEALAGGDVVTDFMEMFGMPPELKARMADEKQMLNARVSDSGRRLGENLRQGLADRGLTLAPGDFHRTYGQFLYMIPGDDIRLTPEQAEAVLEASAPHSDYLARYHGIHFSERLDRIVTGPSTVPPCDGELIAAAAHFIARVAGMQLDLHPDAASPDAEFLGGGGPLIQPVPFGKAADFDVFFVFKRPLADIELIAQICAGDGTPLLEGDAVAVEAEAGVYRATCVFRGGLAAGSYVLGFALRCKSTAGHFDDVIRVKRAVEFSFTGTPSSSAPAAHPSVDCSVVRIVTGASAHVDDGRGSVETGQLPRRVGVGEIFELSAMLRNSSDESWLNISRAALSMCYHWCDETGAMAVFDGMRTALPVRVIDPSQEVAVRMSIQAPLVPGKFRLIVLPVQEGVTWLNSKGFTPAELNVEICAMPADEVD